MILHTIFDPNVVFRNASYEEQTNTNFSDMYIDGVTVQVSQLSNSDMRVERIISTNPMDYLNKKIQPGCIVKKSIIF